MVFAAWIMLKFGLAPGPDDFFPGIFGKLIRPYLTPFQIMVQTHRKGIDIARKYIGKSCTFWVMESPGSFRSVSIDVLKTLVFTNFPKAFLPDKEFHSFNSFLIVVDLQFSCLNLPFASSCPIVVIFLIEMLNFGPFPPNG